MRKEDQNPKKKKFGWGYIVGSLVLGAAAMAAMPAIINGLSDMVSQKIKYPIPESKGPIIVKKSEEEVQNDNS